MARAAIILPVKSQYTQQDSAKIVVTCTAEDQRQLPAADQMHVCMQANTPQNPSPGPAGKCRCETSETPCRTTQETQPAKKVFLS
jgi:hypothetical protein